MMNYFNPMGGSAPKRDGRLTRDRWAILNIIIASTPGLQHDEILTSFCETYGVSRRQLKAEIKTFRLASPPMLQ